MAFPPSIESLMDDCVVAAADQLTETFLNQDFFALKHSNPVVEIAVELAISHARKSIEGSLFAFAESSYGYFLDFSIKFRDGRVSFISQLILHQLILSSLFVESEGFEAIFEHVEIQVLDQGTRRDHLSHHILAVSCRIFPAFPE